MESKLFNVFCLIRGMSCINYCLLKRILDITCGNVLITLPFTDNMIRKNFLHRMLFTDT